MHRMRLGKAHSQQSLLACDSSPLADSISPGCCVSSKPCNKQKCLNNSPTPQGRILFHGLYLPQSLKIFQVLQFLIMFSCIYISLPTHFYLASYCRDNLKHIDLEWLPLHALLPENILRNSSLPLQSPAPVGTHLQAFPRTRELSLFHHRNALQSWKWSSF